MINIALPTIPTGAVSRVGPVPDVASNPWEAVG